MSKMIETFNCLMKGFIEQPTTLVYIERLPEGELRNGSSLCRYKLREVNGKRILGAYGISRFTNWRFYEINEDGSVDFEWLQQEGFAVGESGAQEQMLEHNNAGYERISCFGINTDIG